MRRRANTAKSRNKCRSDVVCVHSIEDAQSGMRFRGLSIPSPGLRSSARGGCGYPKAKPAIADLSLTSFGTMAKLGRGEAEVEVF